MKQSTNEKLAEHANRVLAEWSQYPVETARARMACRIYGADAGTRHWVESNFEDRAKAKPFASDEEVDDWCDEEAGRFGRGLRALRAESASPPEVGALRG